MEFFTPIIVNGRSGPVVKASFHTRPSSDFMIRGGAFYAVFDESSGMWSTNEFDVERLVDQELMRVRDGLGDGCSCLLLRDSTSGAWADYRAWVKNQPDHWQQLDRELTFADTQTNINSFASKRLPYALNDGPCQAWDTLVGRLYSPLEKEKIEWAIGAIASGDSKWIQKFLVFYGGPGTGKSTILKIVERLFEGYCGYFQASLLGSARDQFALESLKANPLVAIDDEGELRKLETNGLINALTSHSSILMNEKHKSKYPMAFDTMLLIATNQPVRITDAKSGLIRRVIDVMPTGDKFSAGEYYTLFNQIDFEKGAIVQHCLNTYKRLGPRYYDGYRPMVMLYNTDSFFNFVEDCLPIFEEQGYTTLSQSYKRYKEYAEESGLEFTLPKYKFREQLKDYFKDFRPTAKVDGVSCRCVYLGFKSDMFKSKMDDAFENDAPPMQLNETSSLLDDVLADCPAQYASEVGAPMLGWTKITTTLKDLDTSLLHYVLPPIGLVTIDFDLKDENGNKSAKLNLKAAANFPPTYAEFSRGGEGLHLEYWYDGDLEDLACEVQEGIEIKFRRNESSLFALRRKHSYSNGLPIAHISEGLPTRRKPMVRDSVIHSEKHLRALILKAMRKEIEGCGYTATAVQFIKKVLDDAYDSGMEYDIEDMHLGVLVFALKSHHQANACVKLVSQMKFQSETATEALSFDDDAPYIFYDVEVFPNLFVVCCKAPDEDVKTFINPSPTIVEAICKKKLIGFNNRRYDNHIMYARMLGFTEAGLFVLSQRIISGDKTAFLREAYGLSYTDVYDFSIKKQSLKKFEIELGIHHQELGLPWDEPVPEDMWDLVAEYCANDVVATEAVFVARKEDWNARQVLSKLSGLSVNDITSAHMAKILFGNDPRPQNKFVYTDLSVLFPGYEFRNGKSYYNGKEYGEGGLAVSVPGVYTDVWLLDIASMHPTSLIQLNYFGPYTSRFAEIVNARLAIKHKDRDALATLLDGMLLPFLGNDEDMKNLAAAFKIVVNQVYGLTSAKFDNKFRDPRNVDNIVAKRGELFMLSLLDRIGDGTWCHVKTDSIKLPNPLPSLVDDVVEYGARYGYTFEHEVTYDRLAIVDKANYIAKVKDTGEWTATGLLFSRPYPFKTLFSGEPITIDDMAEVMGVHTGDGIYKLNEELVEANPHILEEAKNPEVASSKEWRKQLTYVGKIGQFTPVVHGSGGSILLRESHGGFASLSGTKGFTWIETEQIKSQQKHVLVDESYYRKQAEECMLAIFNVSYHNDSVDPQAVLEIFTDRDTDTVEKELGTGLPF